MKLEIDDTSLMMIFLLEECNFTCAHCTREDEPMDPGYELSFEQLRSCLTDCRRLESIRWVHFSGGEPTLWTEGNRDLVDLLLAIAEAGFTPGFTTNGSLFEDYEPCRDFFARYVGGSNMPLRVNLSVDTFHRNFDRVTRRAPSLDNVMKCTRSLPRSKTELLRIVVQVVVSKDAKSLLPDEMIAHYESQGVRFGFVPLFPEGKARSFSHLCPDLASSNPEDLGAYRHVHREDTWKARGRTGNHNPSDHIILIGEDYYVDDPWRKVARLGHLPDTLIRAYSSAGGV